MTRSIPTLYQQVARLFLAAIPAPQTPVMIAAVSAWELQELGNVPQITANNPWNLHGVKGDYGGLAIGDWYAGPGDVHVAVFGSLADGVAASVMNLRAHGSDFAHYDKVLAAAKSGDPIAFLDALAASAWSAGRYGTKNGGPNTLVAIYRTLALPAPAQAPTTGGSTPVNTVTQKQPAISIAVIVAAILAVGEAMGLVKVGDEATLGPQLTVLVGVVIPLLPLLGGWITHNVVFSPATVQQIISTVTPPTVTSPPPATTQPPATVAAPAEPVVVAPPAPSAPAADDPTLTINVDSFTALPEGQLGTVTDGTPRYPVATGHPLRPALIDAAILAFDREDVVSGSIHGHFWRTRMAKPYYIAKGLISPVHVAKAQLVHTEDLSGNALTRARQLAALLYGVAQTGRYALQQSNGYVLVAADIELQLMTALAQHAVDLYTAALQAFNALPPDQRSAARYPGQNACASPGFLPYLGAPESERNVAWMQGTFPRWRQQSQDWDPGWAGPTAGYDAYVNGPIALAQAKEICVLAMGSFATALSDEVPGSMGPGPFPDATLFGQYQARYEALMRGEFTPVPPLDLLAFGEGVAIPISTPGGGAIV